MSLSLKITHLKAFQLLIFLNVFFSLSAQSILEKEIVVKCSEKPLSNIIDSISAEYRINFSFNSSLPVFQKLKSIDERGKLSTVLGSLLSSEPIGFEFINNLVVLYFKSDTESISPTVVKTKFINGRVTDFETGEVLPYATLSLGGGSKGVITNELGMFQLKNGSGKGIDTLTVSYVGFHTFHLSLDWNSDTLLDIHMMKSPISIDLVTIAYYRPNEVLRKVAENFRRNYSDEPRRLLAFFRETTLLNGHYQYVCEALLDIFKSSYANDFRTDRASILKGRKITFEKQKDRVNYKLEGGIYNTLLIDIMKDGASFLMSENADKYDYHFEKLLHDQDRDLIVIAFDQKPNIGQALFSGHLFIDKSDYALVSAEFGISEDGMKLASSILVKKHSRRLKVKPLKTNYKVNYSKHNDRYMLDNITGEVEVEVKEKFFASKKIFRSVTELVVTESDSVNVVVPKRSQSVNFNQVLSENIDDFAPEFWGDANIIVPGQKLQDAISQYRYQQLIDELVNRKK